MSQDLERLDDYIRGADRDTEPAALEAYESDLFERALCGAAPELAFRATLADALRAMHARGTLDLWLTRRGVQRLLQGSLRVQQIEVDPKHPVKHELSADSDLIVTRIPLELSGVRRLDAEILTPTGTCVKVMPDISFDAADGAVFACCEAELARVASEAQMVTRVWATSDAGRNLLVEFRYQ